VDTHSKPITRFINSLGKKPYCTNDFSYGTKIRSKFKALEHEYISLNQRFRRYIVLDIDCEAAALAWEEIGLPPTITVINPENTHAHLMYELKAPVSFSDKSRSKPRDYFKSVERGLIQTLGADTGYSGLMTKNPISDRWRVDYNNGQFSLGEIAEYSGMCSSSKQRVKEEYCEGRNSSLFHAVRHWAYYQVKEYVIFEAWSGAVLDKCKKENDFTPALPYSEVKATAKSIAKWTWRHRHELGNNKNRGAAKVDKRLKLANKQKCGAEYTNMLRKEKTERKIIDAVNELAKKKEKLIISDLVKYSGVSRRTLYNYKGLWQK